MGSGNFRDISYICLQQDILVTSQGIISPVSFFCFRRRSLVGGTVPGSKTDSCLCGVFVPGKRFIWNKMTLGRVPPAKDRPNKEHSNNVPRPMCSRSTPLAQCAPLPMSVVSRLPRGSSNNSPRFVQKMRKMPVEPHKIGKIT